MIGNDVVDLGDPETFEETVHPRWDFRVFTASERALLAGSDDRHRARWTLWACKEAAFKLLRREDRALVFSPPQFEVEIDEAKGATVRHRGRVCRCRIEIRDEDLHVVAVRQRGDFLGVVSAVEATSSDPGTAVRELAVARLAPILGRHPRSLRIVAGGGRIPKLRVEGWSHPGFLSLSHHGRWVAFAFRL